MGFTIFYALFFMRKFQEYFLHKKKSPLSCDLGFTDDGATFEQQLKMCVILRILAVPYFNNCACPLMQNITKLPPTEN